MEHWKYLENAQFLDVSVYMLERHLNLNKMQFFLFVWLVSFVCLFVFLRLCLVYVCKSGPTHCNPSELYADMFL